MKRVLFLCSANYYRSRFAEYSFNWLAERGGLRWRADSRGLMVGHWGELGPISSHCLDRLHLLGIPIDGDLRSPRQLAADDLAAAERVVALKEAEHRKMLEASFPAWVDRVEYWHIDDIDCAEPARALSVLENQVRLLIEQLAEADAAAADGKKVAEDAKHRILHQPHLTHQRIWCECRQGRLSLRGQVPSFYFKQLAQEAVVGMKGVRQIVNEIEVIW